MAYFVTSAQTNGTGAVTSLATNVPPHQTNDILIAVVTVDSGTATIAGSSWADLPSSPASPVTQGTIVYLKYVKAAGSSETLTLTTGDAYTCGIYVFRDVDGTTPFDGVAPKFAGVGTATTTPVNESITPTTADSLIFFAVCQDGTTPQVLSDPGVMFIDGFDSTGTTATTSSHQAAAWYYQRSAAASPVANWSSSVSAVYVRITVTMKNASGGRIPAYIDDSASPGTRLTCGHHVATQNNISYSASGSFIVTANINGKTLTQAAAANGADFGINVYANAVTSTAAATAATALTGPELVLTSGRDLTAGLIMGSVIAGTPKQGAFGLGTVAQGGVVIRVASGANNWNAYQVAARNSIPTPAQRCVFAIQAGYATSDYDTGSSGSATTTSVTYIQMLRNAPSFSSQVYVSELHQVMTQIIAGGDATTPVGIAGMVEIGQSFRLPIIQQAGPSGLFSFAPIQIGGGDAVNFKIDAGSLQFPRRADTTAREIAFHAADNTVGLSLAGKSGDTIKFTNSVVTSPTPYYFEIHSSATSAATWDLSGLVVVGANVTLRNVMTFDSMAFSSCPSLVFSSCTVQNSTISAVPAGNDTLTTNGSTVVSGCSINVSGVTAGNRWCSVVDPSIFSDNSFVGGGGHAIRITTAGSYSFVGNTFSGFGADGSTGAAIYNDSGGAVTLTITGGGSTPTVRNGTGASTTIVTGSVTTEITVKDITTGAVIQNARVLVTASDNTGPMPFEETVTITRSGTTATVSHTAHGLVDGKKVLIKGADQQEYNGVFTITFIDTNSYSYTVSGTPATPATGTIKATGVVIDGLTNASGVISDTRSHASNQPITGRVRKATTGTLYKTGVISGTISSTTGFSTTVQLIQDQ